MDLPRHHTIRESSHQILDPFTDAPFVYEKSATGVRITSAGRLADEEAIDEATLRERCLSWDLKR